MKIFFLVAELIITLISVIVIIIKIKCSRNCGKCRKEVCVKKAELVINPQWVVSFVLGTISFIMGALLLYDMIAWLMLCVGLILLLLTLFFLPFAYRFNHIGIYFLRCLSKNTYIEYDNIDNIRVEESGHMDVGWNVDSILTKDYVITPIKNNRKLFFKKESIFETQKTTAMLKKYFPKKFPKTKGKNKKHKRKKR